MSLREMTAAECIEALEAERDALLRDSLERGARIKQLLAERDTAIRERDALREQLIPPTPHSVVIERARERIAALRDENERLRLALDDAFKINVAMKTML